MLELRCGGGVELPELGAAKLPRLSFFSLSRGGDLWWSRVNDLRRSLNMVTSLTLAQNLHFTTTVLNHCRFQSSIHNRPLSYFTRDSFYFHSRILNTVINEHLSFLQSESKNTFKIIKTKRKCQCRVIVIL